MNHNLLHSQFVALRITFPILTLSANFFLSIKGKEKAKAQYRGGGGGSGVEWKVGPKLPNAHALDSWGFSTLRGPSKIQQIPPLSPSKLSKLSDSL